MDVIGWIFLVIFVFLLGGPVAQAVLLAEAEAEAEEERKRREQETTISNEEKAVIKEIMKKHKWKEMLSNTYELKDYENMPNPKEVAKHLAMRYVKMFAIQNGYDEKVIKKLYYLQNNTYGKACNVKEHYKIAKEPARRDVLTGRITEGYTYKTNQKVTYQIKFFVLET